MSLVRNGSNRAIVYPNEIAFEQDILRTNMYKMADIAFLAQALIGNSLNLGNSVAGLPCTPVALSLNVTIGPGSMYSSQQYDATAYSTIPSDTTDMIYKQAINLSTISTATGSLFPGGPITAPVSSGFSVYWIIEAQFATQDLNSTNRPYYDPANPSVPQFNSYADTRQDYISFKLKQGVPYNSLLPDPTQIPATDGGGYVGLWAIHLIFGQTVVSSGDITQYPGAPFINFNPVQSMPAGVMLDFAGSAAPAGYVLCDGASYSTSLYPNLFAAIGYIWGGSGANFNVPNFARKVSMGSGGSGTAIIGNTVGNTGGEEKHTMLEVELATHSHTGSVVDIGVGTGASTNTVGNNGVTNTGSVTQSVSVAADGSSTPFNIIQPANIVTKIIKY